MQTMRLVIDVWDVFWGSGVSLIVFVVDSRHQSETFFLCEQKQNLSTSRSIFLANFFLLIRFYLEESDSSLRR